MRPDDRALKEALIVKRDRIQSYLNALPYAGHPNEEIYKKQIRDTQKEINDIPP